MKNWIEFLFTQFFVLFNNIPYKCHWTMLVCYHNDISLSNMFMTSCFLCLWHKLFTKILLIVLVMRKWKKELSQYTILINTYTLKTDVFHIQLICRRLKRKIYRIEYQHCQYWAICENLERYTCILKNLASMNYWSQTFYILIK